MEATEQENSAQKDKERAVLAPWGKTWRETGGSRCLAWLEGSLSCEDSTVDPKEEVDAQNPLVEGWAELPCTEHKSSLCPKRGTETPSGPQI